MFILLIILLCCSFSLFERSPLNALARDNEGGVGMAARSGEEVEVKPFLLAHLSKRLRKGSSDLLAHLSQGRGKGEKGSFLVLFI